MEASGSAFIPPTPLGREEGVGATSGVNRSQALFADFEISHTHERELGRRYDERSGRPNTATTDEIILKIHQMVLDDHRIKVRDIAEAMNMSKERVCHVLNQYYGMRRLSTRWEPHLLTLEQKRVRMNISNALLAQFRRNKSSFGTD
ncbi:histone-lysine N-methyltransferase SETMAR [Trichonephila clavipes]|nr:histone-lysine N-methyltransferase SETMAR [Trichonephila clavipes]